MVERVKGNKKATVNALQHTLKLLQDLSFEISCQLSCSALSRHTSSLAMSFLKQALTRLTWDLRKRALHSKNTEALWKTKVLNWAHLLNLFPPKGCSDLPWKESSPPSLLFCNLTSEAAGLCTVTSHCTLGRENPTYTCGEQPSPQCWISPSNTHSLQL